MRLRTAGAKRGLFIILFSPFQKAPWGDGEIGTLISNFFSGCTWTWGRGRGGGRSSFCGRGSSSPRERPRQVGFRSHCESELANDECFFCLFFVFCFDKTWGSTGSFYPSSFTKCISPALLPPFPQASRELGSHAERRLGMWAWCQADEHSNSA